MSKLSEIRELYRNRECRYCRWLRDNQCINGNMKGKRLAFGDCPEWGSNKKKIRTAKRRKITPGARVKLSHNKTKYWRVIGVLGDKAKIRIDKDDRFHEKIITTRSMKRVVETMKRNRKKIKETVFYEIEYEID